MSAPTALGRMRQRYRARVRYRVARSGYLFAGALAVVGVAAVASANNLLFLILAAMLATLMISGFVSRLCLAGLELELALPEHIAARESVTAQIRLRNLKWFPSFAIHVSGRTSPGDNAPNIAIPREVVFPASPGRSTLAVNAEAVFPRRGIHRENLFTIATRFPFGFVERRANVSIRSEVVVYPALRPFVLADEIRDEIRGERQHERRGFGGDFYRLRPYEYHESARYLDWKSSAHTQALQVREFARDERSTFYIFFDERGPAGDAWERSVESCAYLVWTVAETGVDLRFRTQTLDFSQPSEADVYDILRALAVVEASPSSEAPLADGNDPDALFTEDPTAFLQNGWHAARWIANGDVASLKLS